MSDLLPAPRPGRIRSAGFWSLAAACAVCAHAAFAAIVVAELHEDHDDDLGAPGIEIAVELASPQAQPVALPPGPESEASAASSAQAEQKAKPQDSELEPLPESETADLNAVRTPDTVDDSDPQREARQMKAAEEAAAQEAAAPTSLRTAAVAPKATTVDQGTGEALQRVRATWQKELLAHLNRFKRYPADRSGRSADILIAMHLDRSGRVVGASVIRSSGDAAFDRAAVAMVERASPVPVPPPLLADLGLDFELPIRFKATAR
ncbi:MAG: energy transducer TonB family protein [Pseudolabrys sp.]